MGERMADHPYTNRPDYVYWSGGVGRVRAADVDPVVRGAFQISDGDRIVTAGSCFAQHIGRRLREAGFNYHITEPIHPLMAHNLSESFGYGVFSVRYGNLYTSRQLVQLLGRARGDFVPAEEYWIGPNGAFYDPFRPAIQPGGFPTLEELRRDRQRHFQAMLRAFSEMDVFIFTLGLTECWSSKADGAVFPICPGVAAGNFDPSLYEFKNLSVEDIVAEMDSFILQVTSLRPDLKVLLTVSPVPLAATALDRQVLVSTSYSKSVLRVAAELIQGRWKDKVVYFPSYEIISGNFSRGSYYASDLMSVIEDGVDHVMRLFFKHYTDAPVHENAQPLTPRHSALAEMQALADSQCEEAMLDLGSKS